MPTSIAPSLETREEWKRKQLASNDVFVLDMPKIELHVHIEGTMTPDLRWKLSRRNNIPLVVGSSKTPITSLEDLREAYRLIRGRIGPASAESGSTLTFFEAYYGGFEFLQTEEDYFDLAMDYFERAAQMNVRYCEPFFDPQGHTRRGIKMENIMNGFRRAQIMAEKELNVTSQWIMCILRDMSLESAMEQYEAALPYKDMIIAIGLDSDEYNRPPSLFESLYSRAREDGFKLTCHCDFDQKDTHEHIRQVVSTVAGSGADRCDHGMNVADRDDLLNLFKEKGIGLTLCPCSYIRHKPEDQVFPRIRKLFDAGIKITMNSDDPAYHCDNWVLHNLLMVRDKCAFTDQEMATLQRTAVDMSWAPVAIKKSILEELQQFELKHLK